MRRLVAARCLGLAIPALLLAATLAGCGFPPNDHHRLPPSPPPDTQLTGNPANPSDQTLANFTFDCTGGPCTFECQLDGGGWSACTSPKEYSGLSETSHIFSVRAVDISGNPDPTPANYSWTINTAPPAQAVKHIILFIGDGMELADEISLSRYLYGTDAGLSWHSFPYQAYVTTWDVNTYEGYASAPFDEATFDPLFGYNPSRGGTEPYPLHDGGTDYLLSHATDSASSATAIATGRKTQTGNISWLRNDPPGGALTTIAELMRAQRGAAIGVVTTVAFNHATPAAFVSHNIDRNYYSQIADEIINVTKPEVVIGAGHPTWNTTYFSFAQLSALQSSADYSLVERVSGQNGGANLLYAAAVLPENKKLFGLFGGSSAYFEFPVPVNDPGSPGFTVQTENPSLAQATQAALIVLSGDTSGLFLMVEAGDIDKGNDSNNFNAMLGAVWRLEEAVAAAIDFVDLPGDNMDWTNTLLIVTADHSTGRLILNAADPLGQGELPAGGEYSYTTTSHTNQLVTLYAKGAGLDLFLEYEGVRYPGTEILDNTEVFKVMFEAAGLQ